MFLMNVGRKFAAMSAITVSICTPFVMAAEFNAQGNPLAFNNTRAQKVSEVGSASLTDGTYPVGTAFLYSNVITIGGQQIDALVTLEADPTQSITDFDSTRNPYSGTVDVGEANAITDAVDYFQPLFSWGESSSATFSVKFIEGDTFGEPTSPAGVPATLLNIFVNSYDLDKSGSGSGKQYSDFTNITGYTLSRDSKLVVEAVTPNVSRFIPKDLEPDNIQSAPGTIVGDQYRVRVSFASVSDFRFDVGEASSSGLAYYGIDFSEGPTFTNASFSVGAAVNPEGSGTASCTPSAVSAGGESTCTASASDGYVFAGWTGDCAFSTSSTCSLTGIQGDTYSIAQFVESGISYSVTASANPPSGGTVTCNPSSLDAGASSVCTAVPNEGYVFAEWSGACAGQSSAQCDLDNVASNLESTAVFEVASASISLAKTLFKTGEGSCGAATDELVHVDAERQPVDVTWCYEVVNTGNVPLTTPQITDVDLGLNLSNPDSGSLPLMPGSSLLFVYNETGRVDTIVSSATVMMSLENTDGDTVTDSDSASFAYVFDPPSGLKLGTFNGRDRVLWTMVWINDNPVNADGVIITDRIAAGMTYVPGTLSCEARGSTQISGGSCSDSQNFTAPDLLSIEANFGPDFSASDEQSADNELLISFEVLVDDLSSEQSLENQATVSWDPDGPGGATELTGSTDADDSTAALEPASVFFRPTASPAPIPTLPLGGLLTLVGVLGLVASRRASGLG